MAHRSLLSLTLLACLLLEGCGLTYLVHAARGQLGVMAKRQPIDRVIADAATPASLKDQLERVVAIREYAVRELGLPDNGSYRSYADLKRPFVVWNVFAAREFSVEPERWCFPIAGCVAYRGYFSEHKARKFADRLARQQFDVFVAGVPAYSTLGHFDDPVLNTMIGWTDVQLAAIIFHELTHQLLYVPSDSSFNEAFASVVEDQGVRRWLENAGRGAELAIWRQQRQRYIDLVSLLTAARGRLRSLYASGLAPEIMRQRKQEAFAELEREYAKLKASWGGRSGYDAWFATGLNNAHLISVATYQDCVPGLERLLADSGGGLPAFYARARELAKLELQDRHARVCALAAQTSVSELPCRTSAQSLSAWTVSGSAPATSCCRVSR